MIYYAGTVSQKIYALLPQAAEREMLLRAKKLGCPDDAEPLVRVTAFGVEIRYEW